MLEPAKLVLTALKRILRPLVKLLLSHQITYADCARILKECYVEVAEKEFVLAGKPQTDSRLSLLTGIHRKEVKNLRKIIDDQEPMQGATSVPAQIVAAWLSDDKFSDNTGRPYPLVQYDSLHSAQAEPELLNRQPALEVHDQGDTSNREKPGSFEQLVQSISKGNLRSAPVLEECLRLGIVVLDDSKRVCLQEEAFVENEDMVAKLDFFGRNIRDHMGACVHNLLDSVPPYFERSVSYNHLSQSDLDVLTRLLRNEGMDFLKRVNRDAKQLQSLRKLLDESSEDMSRHRMSVGLYFFAEDKSQMPHVLDESNR